VYHTLGYLIDPGCEAWEPSVIRDLFALEMMEVEDNEAKILRLRLRTRFYTKIL
jgi:hypothetical protein